MIANEAQEDFVDVADAANCVVGRLPTTLVAYDGQGDRERVESADDPTMPEIIHHHHADVSQEYKIVPDAMQDVVATNDAQDKAGLVVTVSTLSRGTSRRRYGTLSSRISTRCHPASLWDKEQACRNDHHGTDCCHNARGAGLQGLCRTLGATTLGCLLCGTGDKRAMLGRYGHAHHPDRPHRGRGISIGY